MVCCAPFSCLRNQIDEERIAVTAVLQALPCWTKLSI
jgi:hypothetical protein